MHPVLPSHFAHDDTNFSLALPSTLPYRTIYANLQIRLGNKNADYVGPRDTPDCWYCHGTWELVLATGRKRLNVSSFKNKK